MRRGKEDIPECNKPDIPKNDKISSLVARTLRIWIRHFIYKVMGLGIGKMFGPKEVTQGVDNRILESGTLSIALAAQEV